MSVNFEVMYMPVYS